MSKYSTKIPQPMMTNTFLSRFNTHINQHYSRISTQHTDYQAISNWKEKSPCICVDTHHEAIHLIYIS